MLGKLLKYDLKRLGKQLVAIYLLPLVVATIAVLTNFSLDGEATIITALHVLCTNIAYLFCAGVIFITCVNLWRDFSRSMYGDESYLTHTLPIRVSTLWMAKFIENFVMVLCSICIIVLTLYITLFAEGGIDLAVMVSENITLALVMILVVFLQWLFIVQAGVTGIIIGNMAVNRGKFHSVVWGFVVYLLGMTLTLVVLCVFGYIINDLGYLINNDWMLKSLVLGVVIYAVLNVVTYMVDLKALSRGVNID